VGIEFVESDADWGEGDTGEKVFDKFSEITDKILAVGLMVCCVERRSKGG